MKIKVLREERKKQTVTSHIEVKLLYYIRWDNSWAAMLSDIKIVTNIQLLVLLYVCILFITPCTVHCNVYCVLYSIRIIRNNLAIADFCIMQNVSLSVYLCLHYNFGNLSLLLTNTSYKIIKTCVRYSSCLSCIIVCRVTCYLMELLL